MKLNKVLQTFVSAVAPAAALLALGASPTVAGPPAGYVLSWSDEFNQGAGHSPSSANWNFDLGNNGGWGNNELETYVSDTAHCSIVSDSSATDGQALKITATNTNGYQSARINSVGKETPTYGYFEARIKHPGGKGLWPAWWMLGTNINQVGWPACGEMDIFEIFGGNANTEMASYHMGASWPGITWTATAGTSTNTYHTYGMLWNSSGVTNYIDGNQFEFHSSGSPGWSFNHPEYFLINMAIGGGPPGNPDGSTPFPSSLYVDYVRVYEPGSTTSSSSSTSSSSGGTLTAGVHTLAPQCATGSRLDDSASGTTNGNKIQIWASSGGANQNWNFASVGTNVWNAATLGAFCLDANTGGVGTATRLWSCNGGNAQKWTSVASGSNYVFKNGVNSNCLDVVGAGNANGTVVDSYTCNSSSAQAWAVH